MQRSKDSKFLILTYLSSVS